jgi:predicted Zn-dependent protease
MVVKRLLLCILSISAAFAQDAPIKRDVSKGVNFYSIDKEVALGAQLARDVRKKTTPFESEAAVAYLNRIGPEILQQFGEVKVTLHFDLVRDGAPGAYLEPNVLPGGYIFVPAALFTDARNESEFVGLLAHSIAHVAARHGTRQVSRGQFAQINTIPLIFVGGYAGFGSLQVQPMLLPVGYLAFARGYESEADMLGATAMSTLGYDPKELAAYIGRTQKDSTSRQFALWPPVEDRVPAVERIAEQFKAPQQPPDSSEFNRVQEEIQRLMPRTAVSPAPSLRKD